MPSLYFTTEQPSFKCPVSCKPLLSTMFLFFNQKLIYLPKKNPQFACEDLSLLYMWKKHSLLNVAVLAEHTEGGAWRGTTSSSTTSTQTSPEGQEAQWSTAPPPGVTEPLRSPAAGRRAGKSGRKRRRELWEVSDSQQKISTTSVCKCSLLCFLVSCL